MPELPEVETLRRGLSRSLPGRQVTHVIVRDTRLRMRLVPRQLQKALIGRRVVAVGRRSKYLLLELDDANVLVLHLGMSGRFLLAPVDAPLAAHTHVRIRLDDASELRFQDPRRFGMLFVVPQAELRRHPRFARLGPEPFDPAFTPSVLQARARAARKPIKNVLMDAAVVVGVGNIYACESLHQASVHPMTPARRLGTARWTRLHAAVLAVLQQAVVEGGTTLQDFRDADGQYGAFQNKLEVYGRAGESCRRCGHEIRRIVQAGRSTFYCPGCQH